MVQFLSINFFLGFLQFLLGFSKVPVFCVTLYVIPDLLCNNNNSIANCIFYLTKKSNQQEDGS